MEAPDLSHLTEQERMIIEKVMARQKEEEDKEKEVFKKKQDEVRLLETAIRMRSEELLRKEGGSTDLNVTCQICLKTKFADGVGHVCHYCAIRCCARCGGKVSLRSNKVIWVCILCRKKQELVIKTGQWVQGGTQVKQGGHKLDRARSLDKERTSPPGGIRGTLQRQSSHPTSTYRRQYSNESNPDHLRQMYNPSSTISSGKYWDEGGRQPQLPVIRSDSTEERRYHLRYDQEEDHQQTSGRRSRSPSTRDGQQQRERSRRRDETNNRHRRDRSASAQRGDRRSPPREDQYPPPRSPPPHFRSSPYYEEGGRDGSGGAPWPGDASRRAAATSVAEQMRTDSLSSDQSESTHHRRQQQPQGPPRRSHHPHQGVPKDHHHHHHARRVPHLQRSFSSSEDEIRSTPEYSSCEDSGPDSLSERGDRHRLAGGRQTSSSSRIVGSRSGGTGTSNPGNPRLIEPSSSTEHEDQQQVRTRRRPLLGREVLSGSGDQSTKDSGIDTSSSATLNDDHQGIHRHDVQHPVSWKQSSDGKRMVGHMILKKAPSIDAGSGHGLHQGGLGMRVVGGRILESGRLGAVVENIKRGGIADLVGRIRPGDEVVEWNGICLQDKTYEEVYEIISQSKQEPQVELVICRQIKSDSLQYRRPRHYEIHPEVMTRERSNPRYRRSATSPRSPEANSRRSPNVGGRIQIKLWYEPKHLQLVVTVVRAVDLPPRSNMQPRNPYVKILLLPDRSEKSKRRTKTIASSNEPKWSQSFVYAPLRRSDLRNRRLEVSVWDYDRYAANDFLGEVVLELGSLPLDDEPEWHLLTTHEDSLSSQMRRQGLYEGIGGTGPGSDTIAGGVQSATDRLSPPSTTSRLSDSELSEDFEDKFSTQTERRMLAVDGASISSSMGSSSSPPFPPYLPTEEMATDRRSRREMAAITSNPYRHMGAGGHVDEGVSLARGRRDTVVDPMMLRGRSRSVAPGDGIRGARSPTRRAADSSSRSLSPPEMRPRSPAISSRHPYPQTTGRRMPSSSVAFKKRQLPQIPPFRSSSSPSSRFGYDRSNRSPYAAVATSSGATTHRQTSQRHLYDVQTSESSTAGYPEVHRGSSAPFEPRPRRGGGSRMAAALGVSGGPGGSGAPLPLSPEGGGAGAMERSDSESSSKYSITSAFGSTQLHKNSRTLSEFTTRIQQGYGPVHPEEKTDGSLSDTALGSMQDQVGGSGGMQSRHRHLGGGSTGAMSTEPRPSSGGSSRSYSGGGSGGKKMAQFMGLSKRSSSTSQLSVTGNKKRLGFRRKPTTSIVVQRSEEILPDDLLKMSAGSVSSDGEGSLSGDSLTWMPVLRITDEGEMSSFVEGLGPGQLVGRQALASPALGEVQLSLCERKSKLEVEVIRARGLQVKPNAKILPAPYVKVYLLKGRKCVAKAKTSVARRTRDPLYQEQLVFHEDFRNCCLQVTVWGDYSRMEKKVFMGVSQIMLDDLDLSNLVIGWYKLFHHTSLVNVPNVGSTRNSSLLSLDSFG